MSNQTVRPLTAKQAGGLAGANANAVNTGITNFAVAQYLLTKKGLLNEHYALLVRLVEEIVQWQELFRYVFGVRLDLQNLVKLPRGSMLLNSIVDPTSEMLPLETIFYKCCQEFGGVVMLGDAWKERAYPGYGHSRDSTKDAAKFLADHCTDSYINYLYRPLEILIAQNLTLPRIHDNPPTQCFAPHDLEISRCISLRELLIWVLIDRYRTNLEQGKGSWKPPLYKVWCLGSKGYAQGFRFVVEGVEGRSVEGEFYPLVYWIGEVMYIDCTVRQRGDESTGTYYVFRPPS